MRPLLLLWVTVAVLSCSAPDAPPTMTAVGPTRTGVILAGDAVATPLVRALAGDFTAGNPGAPITVAAPLGTEGALLALDARRLSAALVVTTGPEPPRPGAFFLGRTRVVVAVGPGVRERALDGAALVALFAGRTSQWADSLPVHVLLGASGDAPERALSDVLPALGGAIEDARGAHRWPVESGADTRRSRLERTPGSVTIAAEGNLRLEGTAAWMVTLKDVPTAHVFLWLVLGTDAGPRLRALARFTASTAAHSIMSDFGFEPAP